MTQQGEMCSDLKGETNMNLHVSNVRPFMRGNMQLS